MEPMHDGTLREASMPSGPVDSGALLRAAEAVRAAVPHATRWRPSDRAAVIVDLDRTLAALISARAQLLVADRDSGLWRASGERSYEAVRAKATHEGQRAAILELRRGDALVTMGPLRAAVDAGEVSLEHVDVLARLAATAPASVRAALAEPNGTATLVEMARRVDAGQFVKAVAAWAAEVDHAAAEAQHQDDRAARFLTLTKTRHGARISGRLDPIAGHRLALALEAVAGKPAPDDPRTREQRAADALDALAGAALADSPRADGASGRRPHVSLVMTLPAWRGLRERTTSESRSTTAPPVALEDGTPVPDSEAARALCDCELTRIVVNERSEPVDVGRTTRSHTPSQRRAVAARDKGCLWPGCSSPARWCEVHHLVWWDRDHGDTTVIDGALACSFHHHEIHRRDLVIARYSCPPDTCPPGTPQVRYVVALGDGSVLADGRPPDGDGRLGRAERTWIPGVGARPGAPPTTNGANGAHPPLCA